MNAVSVSFIPLAAFFSALNMLGMCILQLMLVRFKGTGEFRVATDVPIRFITRDRSSTLQSNSENIQIETWTLFSTSLYVNGENICIHIPVV